MAKQPQVPPVPAAVKWEAFVGWLVLPVLAAWATVAVFDAGFLWSGPIWFGYAVAYMAAYFGWVRRRVTRLASSRRSDGNPAAPRRSRT